MQIAYIELKTSFAEGRKCDWSTVLITAEKNKIK